MTARSRRPRWPALALMAGLALGSGAAAGYAATRPPGHDYGTVPPAGADPAGRHPAAAAPAPAAHRPNADPSTPSPNGGVVIGVVRVPVRLRIPAIGVNAPVQPTGVEPGGELAIPPDPADVGWWAGGASPGAPAGAVILAGHIDSAASGPGALLRLQDARPGMSVTVAVAGRTYSYRVAAVRAYPKSDLPSAAIFGQQVTARLVIISCGGPFDAATGHYLENIVAYAVPAGRSA